MAFFQDKRWEWRPASLKKHCTQYVQGYFFETRTVFWKIVITWLTWCTKGVVIHMHMMPSPPPLHHYDVVGNDNNNKGFANALCTICKREDGSLFSGSGADFRIPTPPCIAASFFRTSAQIYLGSIYVLLACLYWMLKGNSTVAWSQKRLVRVAAVTRTCHSSKWMFSYSSSWGKTYSLLQHSLFFCNFISHHPTYNINYCSIYFKTKVIWDTIVGWNQ